MPDLKHVIDATPETFAELVIGNSMRGPVMVNFWSAKAGPCIKLWPLLEKLVAEYTGKFLLINFNTDKYLDFSRKELGVTSVPTIRMYHQQQVVDVIHGAESETSFRAMIEKHLPRPSDPLLHDAVKLYQEKNVEESFSQLKKLQQNDPDNPRIPITYIKLLFREGRFGEMFEYIQTLPTILKDHEEIINLTTHAKFIQAAQSVDDKQKLEQKVQQSPEDVALRYQLSAALLMEDQYTQAMDQLLEIIRLDRDYKEDVGVKGMVSILNLIANGTEKVKLYRQKMIDVISR